MDEAVPHQTWRRSASEPLGGTPFPRSRIRLHQGAATCAFHATVERLERKATRTRPLTGQGDTVLAALSSALGNTKLIFATEQDEIDVCRATLRGKALVIEQRHDVLHVLPPQ